MAQTINADDGVISGSAGLKSSSDGTAILSLQTKGTTALTVDGSQNVGIGVTPSAWQSTRRVVQVGANGGALWGINSGVGTCFLSNNTYYDGTNFRYINTANATYYAQSSDGKHEWYTAASGTAGNNISFTQAMTLDSSGNLGVGTTNIPNLLQVGGALGLNNSVIRSSDTSGDFTLKIGGLQPLSGGAWYEAAVLVFHQSVIGTLSGSTALLTYIRLRGLSTYDAAVVSNIVGTATISVANATSSGLDITFDVADGSVGSVFAVVISSDFRPTLSITA